MRQVQRNPNSDFGGGDVFEGYRKFDIQTSDPQVKIRGVIGGSGPPLLLLHGNPLTHIHWHLVAPRLAQDFTVVATDLRGYGDSGKPRGLADHSNYSFRRMAQDQVDVMSHLGFSKFGVAGHDRGARTAYRMTLDHPDKVQQRAYSRSVSSEKPPLPMPILVSFLRM